MAIHKNKLRREARDHKQERKFFITLGVITVVLILIIFLIYS